MLLRPAFATPEVTMIYPRQDSILAQLLTDFLTDHQAQLSPEGYRRYAYILDLLELFLERHRPGRRRREWGPMSSVSGTSGGLLGAADLTRSRAKFLGEFLHHEMAVDAETLQLARAVTQELGVWLAAQGYVPRG
jgi:hypothetical protein